MKFIKRNYYTVVTIFVLVLSFFFLYFIQQNYEAEVNEVDHTTVGSIYIGKRDSNGISTLINTWQETARYKIVYKDVDFDINGFLIDDEVIASYDINLTMANIIKNNMENDITNKVYYTISETGKDKLQAKLVEKFGQEIFDDLDFEGVEAGLVTDIEKKAGNMKTTSEFRLENYLTGLDNVTVSSITLSGSGEESGKLNDDAIDSIIEILNDINEDDRSGFEANINIPSQDTSVNSLGFSACTYFEDYYNNYKATHTQNELDLLGERLDIIVTGLAAVIQESSFYVTVKDQANGADEVDYAYNFMTARIKMGTTRTDFRFINPESTPYYIGINKVSPTELNFQLVGCKFIKKYVVEFEPYIVELHKDPVLEYTPDLTQLGDDIQLDIYGGIYYYIDEPEEPGRLITYNRLVLDNMRANATLQESGEFYDIYIDNDIVDANTANDGVEGYIVLDPYFNVYTDDLDDTYELVRQETVYKKQEYYATKAATGRKKELTAGAIYAFGYDDEGNWTQELIILYCLMMDYTKEQAETLIFNILGITVVLEDGEYYGN